MTGVCVDFPLWWKLCVGAWFLWNRSVGHNKNDAL